MSFIHNVRCSQTSLNVCVCVCRIFGFILLFHLKGEENNTKKLLVNKISVCLVSGFCAFFCVIRFDLNALPVYIIIVQFISISLLFFCSLVALFSPFFFVLFLVPCAFLFTQTVLACSLFRYCLFVWCWHL